MPIDFGPLPSKTGSPQVHRVQLIGAPATHRPRSRLAQLAALAKWLAITLLLVMLALFGLAVTEADSAAAQRTSWQTTA